MITVAVIASGCSDDCKQALVRPRLAFDKISVWEAVLKEPARRGVKRQRTPKVILFYPSVIRVQEEPADLCAT